MKLLMRFGEALAMRLGHRPRLLSHRVLTCVACRPPPPRSDIQYVLSGAVHEFGMGTRFANLLEEVHRSNMTKACKTKLEAEATVKHYMDKDGTKAHIKVRSTLLANRALSGLC